MTEGMALEIAKNMMAEKGKSDYQIRYRHFQLQPKGELEIKADNMLIILIKPSYYLKAYSKAGMFNLADISLDEQQYVHRGLTKLINLNGRSTQKVVFLQIFEPLKIK